MLVKKAVASAQTPPLADQDPYDKAPFQIMAATSTAADSPRNLAAIVSNQAASKKRLLSVEMILLGQAEFGAAGAAAKQTKIRRRATTLDEGAMLSLTSIGGDVAALRDPESSWGYLTEYGASMLLTDEPGPLLRYLKTRREKH